jgi:protein PhnA
MDLNPILEQRCGNRCELCDTPGPELTAYAVPPKEGPAAEETVALCPTCIDAMGDPLANADHWRCLTGSIWSEVPAVQTLSLKLLNALPAEEWAVETIESVDLPESVTEWATAEQRATGEAVIHKDAYGAVLAAGDTILLTQNLNVKGTNFIAPKGTAVKKIRLVADNAEQIEGKINGDTIVILTKFVRKQ